MSGICEWVGVGGGVRKHFSDFFLSAIGCSLSPAESVAKHRAGDTVKLNRLRASESSTLVLGAFLMISSS